MFKSNSKNTVSDVVALAGVVGGAVLLVGCGDDDENHDTDFFSYYANKHKDSMGGGAIAGIVIGVLVAVALIAWWCTCLRRVKKNKRKTSESEKIMHSDPADVELSQGVYVNYSDSPKQETELTPGKGEILFEDRRNSAARGDFDLGASSTGTFSEPGRKERDADAHIKPELKEHKVWQKRKSLAQEGHFDVTSPQAERRDQSPEPARRNLNSENTTDQL